MSQATQYEGATTLLVVVPAKQAISPSNSATFRAIIENGSLASQVVSELGLAQPPHNLTPQGFLERALNVEQVSGTNLVRVKVRLGVPTLAAEASRRLARKAILLTQRVNQEEGSSIQEQLKNHLNDAAHRMSDAESELLAYQQHAQVELLSRDTQALLEKRGDLLRLVVDIEREKARLSTAEQEIKRQEPVLTVGRAVGAEQAMRRVQQQDAEAGTAVDPENLDLTNRFVNPVYQTLDYQLATSRARLASLERERQQLLDVNKLGGQELAQLSDLYRRQIEQARLQTRFDLAKRVYSDLSVRYEESRTEAFGNTAQLQLIDEAILPDRPLSRRRATSSLLGTLAGVMAACLTALALEGRLAERHVAS